MHFSLKAILSHKAIKDMGFYFFASVAKSALPFIILPILTLYLVPEEYGKWGIFTSLLSLCMPITALGLSMVIGRGYHLHEAKDHRVMVTTAIAINALTSLVMIGIIAWLHQSHDTLFSLPIWTFYILAGLCFFKNIQYFNKIILRHQNKALTFSILDFMNAATLRVTGLLAVVFIAASWTSLLWMQIVTQIIFLGIALYLMTKAGSMARRISFSKAKSMTMMGWPLVPHALGGIVMTTCDRLILERMTSVEDVGIYSVGANLGMAVMVFSYAFNNRWGPWMHRQMKQITDEKKQKIVTYSYGYFILTILIALAIAFGAILYIRWLLPPAYQEAQIIVGWVAAGACFYGMSQVLSHYLIVLGKTKIFPVITGSCAVLNVALTIYLVSINGYIGAAQATFISYCVFFIISFIVCQRHYPMPWLTVFRHSLERLKK
jgi:O-antigen/teichoic acid export membrane protein